MTVRDALLANHDLAGRGSMPAERRRNALLTYARARGVTCEELADLLDTARTNVFNWSGGRIARGTATLGDRAPEELRPPNPIPVPIPGQEALL